jgi:hypothetical protein
VKVSLVSAASLLNHVDPSSVAAAINNSITSLTLAETAKNTIVQHEETDIMNGVRLTQKMIPKALTQ